MSLVPKHFYEFGPYRLDPVERRLSRDGEPVPLTPKSFDLLVVLVENVGHLLEKDELLTRLWPNQFVEEGSLSFNISALRKALGEGQSGKPYIETVRTKGFRFVAPVEEHWDVDEATAAAEGRGQLSVSDVRAEEVEAIEAPSEGPATGAAPDRGAARSRWSPASRILVVALVAVALGLAAYVAWMRRGATAVGRPPRTIAVLPFKPLVASSRDEPLEIGMCDALITRLGGLNELVVRPTSTVVAYNKMGQDPLAAGRELGVEVLLDGYVQRSEDRIRVTAQLLSVADGKALWSGQYNEKFTDIFTVEDSISRQMVDALRLNLTGDEQRLVTKHGTENAEAYELYLRGRYFQDKRTPEGLKKSVDYFQQAIDKDPNYALGYAGLADSYIAPGVRFDLTPKEAYLKAKAAATRALEIDETIAEAHASLGNVRYWYDWDWPGAESEFKRALELRPEYSVAHQYYAAYLLAMGRQQEALSEIKEAQRLAPLALAANVQLARILYFLRRDDEAIEQCRRTLEIEPNSGGAHLFLGRAYAQQGRYPEALAELETARALLRDSAEVTSIIGYTDAVSGRRRDAQKVVKILQGLTNERYVSPYHLAIVYAGLGESDRAIEYLEKAFEDREGRMTILRLAPEFDSLHSDARFAALVRRMNLP